MSEMLAEVDRTIASIEEKIAYYQSQLKGYQERRKMFETVLLLWWQGYRTRVIVEKLGVNAGTVGSIVSRARKKGDPLAKRRYPLSGSSRRPPSRG